MNRRGPLPETLRLWIDLARPDKVSIDWYEQLDKIGNYFKVKTTSHLWLVKQEGNEIQCWRET